MPKRVRGARRLLKTLEEKKCGPDVSNETLTNDNPSFTSWLTKRPVTVSVKEEVEAQMKADKIKLALEKLKEAKVKKVSFGDLC